MHALGDHLRVTVSTKGVHFLVQGVQKSDFISGETKRLDCFAAPLREHLKGVRQQQDIYAALSAAWMLGISSHDTDIFSHCI